MHMYVHVRLSDESCAAWSIAAMAACASGEDCTTSATVSCVLWWRDAWVRNERE